MLRRLVTSAVALTIAGSSVVTAGPAPAAESEPPGGVGTDAPTLTIDGPSPLPRSVDVVVSGSGLPAGTTVRISQCATSATGGSCRSVDGVEVRPDGTITATLPLRRVLEGTDCVGEDVSCTLSVEDEADRELVAVALEFDPDAPVPPVELAVEPATGLRHEQAVTLTGAGFHPDEWLPVSLCALDGDGVTTSCRHVGDGVVLDGDGRLDAELEVPRLVGTTDCAEVSCVLRVDWEATDIDRPVAFDPSLPPPPAPSLSVEPATGLADRQVVEVALAHADPSAYVTLEICETGGAGCSPLWWGFGDEPAGGVDVALPRRIADVDCASTACELRAGYGGVQLSAAVAFDPDAPPAPAPSWQVEPTTGLVDNQVVVVRGEHLDPGGAAVAQCTTRQVGVETCSDELAAIDIEASGTAVGRLRVRRMLTVSGTQHDCAVVECFLVVTLPGDRRPSPEGEPPDIAFPLTFDPDGPVTASDLPTQAPCVPWPTEGWPVGEVPAGVDAAELDRVGRQLVGGDAGADSLVVIYGGRLVYERYAEGVTADSILPSWSMSKSFASTVVGRLVDEGELALDERAPIAEWAGADDPRRAITLRHLLTMHSGLQWESEGSPDEDTLRMIRSVDAAAFAIAKPLEAEPGTRYLYSTGDSQILARVIADTADVSGDAYLEFLDDILLEPLGIDPAEPWLDRSGTWAAGWRTDTTARGFAKLGLLYLRNGVWEDEQFLSSDWVEFVRTPSATNPGYGGQFWLDSDGSFRMVGFQGQAVHIVPDRDLVVVMNNGAATWEIVGLFAGAESVSCDGEPPVVAPPVTDPPASEPPRGEPVGVSGPGSPDGEPVGAGSGDGGPLASTGSEPAALLALAGTALALGAALVGAARRRRVPTS